MCKYLCDRNKRFLPVLQGFQKRDVDGWRSHVRYRARTRHGWFVSDVNAIKGKAHGAEMTSKGQKRLSQRKYWKLFWLTSMPVCVCVCIYKSRGKCSGSVWLHHSVLWHLSRTQMCISVGSSGESERRLMSSESLASGGGFSLSRRSRCVCLRCWCFMGCIATLYIAEIWLHAECWHGVINSLYTPE